jgi:hypothetical protein
LGWICTKELAVTSTMRIALGRDMGPCRFRQ